MINKPDKYAKEITSYRPISFLPNITKLLEKIDLMRLEILLNIPDHQFRFPEKQSTIDQTHRITSAVQKAYEKRKYCAIVLLDVA